MDFAELLQEQLDLKAKLWKEHALMFKLCRIMHWLSKHWSWFFVPHWVKSDMKEILDARKALWSLPR